MNALIVALRLIHIVLGSLWVGAVVFTAVFLGPAVQETGPDGAKVIAALQRRGLMTALPIIAIATLLSGLWLYWQDTGHFQVAYVTSPVGLAFGLGGAAAIIAFAIGISVMRPAMNRTAALVATMGSAPEPERSQRMAEIQRLRARGAVANRIVAGLLVAAVAAMAVARYIR